MGCLCADDTWRSRVLFWKGRRSSSKGAVVKSSLSFGRNGTLLGTGPNLGKASNSAPSAEQEVVEKRITEQQHQLISDETSVKLNQRVATHAGEGRIKEISGDRLIKNLAATYDSMTSMAAESKVAKKPSPFRAVGPLSISVHDYLTRLFKYFKCSEPCLITSLVYVDRIIKLHQDDFQLDDRSIHRVLAISFLLSAKFNDDVYYSNAYYAKVCGMSLKELNYLEAHFLKSVNWGVYVSPQEYFEYYFRLSHATKTANLLVCL